MRGLRQYASGHQTISWKDLPKSVGTQTYACAVPQRRYSARQAHTHARTRLDDQDRAWMIRIAVTQPPHALGVPAMPTLSCADTRQVRWTTHTNTVRVAACVARLVARRSITPGPFGKRNKRLSGETWMQQMQRDNHLTKLETGRRGQPPARGVHQRSPRQQDGCNLQRPSASPCAQGRQRQ